LGHLCLLSSGIRCALVASQCAPSLGAHYATLVAVAPDARLASFLPSTARELLAREGGFPRSERCGISGASLARLANLEDVMVEAIEGAPDRFAVGGHRSSLVRWLLVRRSISRRGRPRRR